MNPDHLCIRDVIVDALERDGHLEATARRSPIDTRLYSIEKENIRRLVAPYKHSPLFAAALVRALRNSRQPTRRDFLTVASIPLLAAAPACGSNRVTAPTPTPVATPSPPPPPLAPSGVDFTNSIVRLYTGAPAGKGEMTIDGIKVPIENGIIRVTREMGLRPGTYPVGPIVTSLGEDRYADVIVSNAGLSVDLMDGRVETPLNVVEKGAINFTEFAELCLRRTDEKQPFRCAAKRPSLLERRLLSAWISGQSAKQG